MQRLFIILILLSSSVSLIAQKTDTIKPRATRQWTLSDDYSEEVNISLDTAFSLYHRARRTDKVSPFNAFPGNYGLPLYQFNFFDRVTDPDKFLYRNLYPFMHTQSNAHFLNTGVPFTEMVFSYAGPRPKAEQNFRVRHSQNVNRFMNFGLVFDVAYSLGQYIYQRSNDKTFAFHFSYTGNKYKAYIQAGFNNLVTEENGGIVNPEQLRSFDTRDVEVKLGGLNKSQNSLKNWNLLVVQKFTLNRQPKESTDSIKPAANYEKFRLSGVVTHIFTYETTRRSYYDYYPASGFYDTSYFNTQKTSDTLTMRVMKNTVRFDFSTDERRKFRLGGGFGIRNELFRYTQGFLDTVPHPPDSISWNRSNNALVGRLYNNIGSKFRWIAEGELYFSGYRAGDFDVKGDITRSFDLSKGSAVWNITGGVSSITPSEWYNRWVSNNFKWNNSFGREFRINAGTDFTYPAWRLYFRFNYAIIDNYTYFGADALPAQHSGGLSVLSVMLKKELSAWKFHLANEVLFQESTNRNVLDLPLLTFRSAGFFEHNFHFKLTNGDLMTQIGAEIFYYTSFEGYGWMPATSNYFQVQNNSTGNYPYLNAFLNVKIKRTRIFLMLDHFNSGWSGYNYYMVPGYPMNVRCFRYGFAWTFYD